ncbi:MAG: SGNH/GDSL hydrolase family protein [Bacteroidetes bacterium]|nr:SGNH/GDSL hydrolase family protein [Bacteroidota bacterium]
MAIGLLIALVLTEIALRVFPNKYTHWGSTYYHLRENTIGLIPAPGQKNTSNKDCFRIKPIITNSIGFRDSEWDTEADFKIAVLGDSYMEAEQVSEGDNTAAIMQKLIGKEVMNAGIKHAGTVTQYLIYQKFLKPLKPDLVILFFYGVNDISENSCQLKFSGYQNNELPCAELVDGGYRIHNDFSRASLTNTGLGIFLKRYSMTYRVIKRLQNDLRIRLKDSDEEYGLFYQGYVPGYSDEWADAWKITELVLLDMKAEIEADGGQFIIVPIPDHLTISEYFIDRLKKIKGLENVPEYLDPYYPFKRINGIIEGHDILSVDPGPFFRNFQKANRMPYPYFYYHCDTHWNPIGHFLVANLVSQYIVSNKLIPYSSEQRQAIVVKINANLRLTPEQILSQKGYDQIFENEKFSGETNISNILNK